MSESNTERNLIEDIQVENFEADSGGYTLRHMVPENRQLLSQQVEKFRDTGGLKAEPVSTRYAGSGGEGLLSKVSRIIHKPFVIK